MSIPDCGAPAAQTPPEPFFIGIDLSLASTGIATLHGTNARVARVRTTPTGPTSGEKAARVRSIVDEVVAHVPLADHTFVAVEGPAFGMNDPGAHIRAGLWWMLRAELLREGVDTIVVPPTTVKKYATGKGNAQKDAVLAAVIRRYPHVDVTGNDEADALVLAAIRARYNGHPVEESLPEAHLAAMKGSGR